MNGSYSARFVVAEQTPRQKKKIQRLHQHTQWTNHRLPAIDYVFEGEELSQIRLKDQAWMIVFDTESHQWYSYFKTADRWQKLADQIACEVIDEQEYEMWLDTLLTPDTTEGNHIYIATVIQKQETENWSDIPEQRILRARHGCYNSPLHELNTRLHYTLDRKNDQSHHVILVYNVENQSYWNYPFNTEHAHILQQASDVQLIPQWEFIEVISNYLPKERHLFQMGNDDRIEVEIKEETIAFSLKDEDPIVLPIEDYTNYINALNKLRYGEFGDYAIEQIDMEKDAVKVGCQWIPSHTLLAIKSWIEKNV